MLSLGTSYGTVPMTAHARLRRLIYSVFAALVALTASSTPVIALPLTPLIGGSFPVGAGANSRWVQVAPDWRGSIYGTESWGTGIWGLSDAEAVLALGETDPAVVAHYDAVVGPVHFADQQYLDAWGSTWGAQTLAPVLDPTPGSYQDNWVVRFSGYIAITDPGQYNFSVLYDDGFSLDLFGTDGTLSLLKDGLNPRDRLGFAEDLDLLPGLYGFTLTAWDRLEAGVVSLDWIRPGGTWEPAPVVQLIRAVPAPSAAWSLLPGLLALWWRRRGWLSTATPGRNGC